VLGKLRRRQQGAGLEHKSKLLDQAQELLGYHGKSAIRALRAPALVRVRSSSRGVRETGSLSDFGRRFFEMI
jgi:hypothetical protein